MSLFRFILLFSIPTCFINCANQSSPTGGPKDVDPPILESSSPKPDELNFTEKKIELVFNEFIRLENIKEQLIISPKINQEYKSKYKKNRIIIEFEQPLDSNTTYTFSFRESIKDITESNFPPNLKLAFSTGYYMDSLSISGKAIDLLKQQPLDKITISLYQAKDTLDPFNSPPLYLAVTNAVGAFQINNIKQGEYKIYAFTDNNKNLQLESSSEKYAFHPSTLKLDSAIAALNLELFGLDTSPLELQSARTSGHYYILKYNKFITNYEITNYTNDTIITRKNEEGKEIKFYNTFPITDSLMFTITATDSLNIQRTDTAYLKFEETKREKDRFDYKIFTKDIDPSKPQLDININFSKPSYFVNNDSLFIELDSINKIYFSEDNYSWSDNNTRLKIIKPLNLEVMTIKDSIKETQRTKFNLYAGTQTFMSIEQDSSSTLKKTINTINTKNVGLIKVEILTDKPNYTLQLLNKQFEVIKEVHNIKSHSFDNLSPGQYQLRVLIDSNNDGIWNTGNILTNQSAEPIHYYQTSEGKKELTLRANWELGPHIISF